MRRQFVAVGLAIVALMLSAFIVTTMAVPEASPLYQSTEEQEPNSQFSQSNPVALPGYITGVLSNSSEHSPELDTPDYFSLTTASGRECEASLDVIQNPGEMLLRMRLYNGSLDLIATSLSSAVATELESTASDTLYYVRGEALSVATSTVLIARYQLDVDEMATPPTPPPPPPPRAELSYQGRLVDPATGLPVPDGPYSSPSASTTDLGQVPPHSGRTPTPSRSPAGSSPRTCLWSLWISTVARAGWESRSRGTPRCSPISRCCPYPTR